MSDTLQNAIEQWVGVVMKSTLSERLSIPQFQDPALVAPVDVAHVDFTTPSPNAGSTINGILEQAKRHFENAGQAIAQAVMAGEADDIKGAGNLFLTAAQQLQNCKAFLIQAANTDQAKTSEFKANAYEIGIMSAEMSEAANRLLTEYSRSKVTLLGTDPMGDKYAETFVKPEKPSEFSTTEPVNVDALRLVVFLDKASGIPPLNTHGIGNDETLMHLHYSNANADFYVAELDPITKQAWGYARTSGSEAGQWGEFNLNDLADYGKDAETVEALFQQGGPVERDEMWEATPAGEIPGLSQEEK